MVWKVCNQSYAGDKMSSSAMKPLIQQILTNFREMRCLRHKIHIGLFLTFLLADLSWIFTALIQVCENLVNSLTNL
jgi:hypothetical protein